MSGPIRKAMSTGPGRIQPGIPKQSYNIGDDVSFKDAVGRWYENTGGIDKEIEASQKALSKYGNDFGDYGNWDAADAERKIPIIQEPLTNQTADGAYDPNRSVIIIPPGKTADRPTIEHEATHGLLLPTIAHPLARGFRDASARDYVWDNVTHPLLGIDSNNAVAGTLSNVLMEQIDNRVAMGIPRADAEADVLQMATPELGKHVRYIMRNGEIDPRLAEIRRWYTHATGNTVRTPRDAQKAWDWYQTHLPTIEDFAHSVNKPTLNYPEQRLYDRSPPGTHEIFFRRMTQVPSVLAPLIGAGGQQQQQQQRSPFAQGLLE